MLALRERYQRVTIPVVIMMGGDDRVIDPAQSERLSRKINRSLLMKLPGHGHMVHQTATAKVLTAIIAAAESSDARPSTPINSASAAEFHSVSPQASSEVLER